MKLKRLIEVVMVLGSLPFVVMLHGCQENDWRFRECVCLEQPGQTASIAGSESDLPACHWTDSFDFILPNHEILDYVSESVLHESEESQEIAVSKEQMKSAGASKSRKQPKPVERRVVAVNTGNCIDINTADVAQLTSLPGVGKGRAEAIIQSRSRKPFKRKKDITRIKGIGAQSYRKMADSICEIVAVK